MFGYAAFGAAAFGDPGSAGAVAVPTGTITSQPAPSGQSQRFVGTTSNATSGTYTLTGANSTMGPTAFAVTANSFDFTVIEIPGDDTYSVLLTVTGPGGIATVSGTSSFTIVGVTGGGEVDTTGPVMVGTLASSAITASGFTLTWSAATDAVGVTGYQYSINGGAYVDISNVLTYAFTGLPASTLHAMNVRAYDAAGNFASPLSINVTTAAAPDATAPVMVGALVASSISSGSFRITWQAATDAVGVTGYAYSIDGGAYLDAGLVLTRLFSGLVADTAYLIDVRAYDAAGNQSAPISISVTTASTVTEFPMSFTPSPARTVTINAGLRPFTAGDLWNMADPKKPRSPKDADATIDYSFNWSPWLDDVTDTIASHEIILTEGLALVGSSVSGKVVSVFVSGGQPTKRAGLTCRITTNSTPPRVEDRTVYLDIEAA